MIKKLTKYGTTISKKLNKAVVHLQIQFHTLKMLWMILNHMVEGIWLSCHETVFLKLNMVRSTLMLSKSWVSTNYALYSLKMK